jgi:hypothetical protein
MYYPLLHQIPFFSPLFNNYTNVHASRLPRNMLVAVITIKKSYNLLLNPYICLNQQLSCWSLLKILDIIKICSIDGMPSIYLANHCRKRWEMTRWYNFDGVSWKLEAPGNHWRANIISGTAQAKWRCQHLSDSGIRTCIGKAEVALSQGGGGRQLIGCLHEASLARTWSQAGRS